MTTINVFGTKKKVTLSRFSENTRVPCVIMEAIDDKTEEEIDAIIKYGGNVTLKSKNIIDKTNIYVYGDINVESKTDILYLQKFKNIILNPYNSCTFIPTGFDFKKGTYTYDECDGPAKGSPFQSNYLKWFKWNYCLIGKPKKIIIYCYPNRR